MVPIGDIQIRPDEGHADADNELHNVRDDNIRDHNAFDGPFSSSPVENTVGTNSMGKSQ